MFKNSMAVSHSEEFAVRLFVFICFLFIFLVEKLRSVKVARLDFLGLIPPKFEH